MTACPTLPPRHRGQRAGAFDRMREHHFMPALDGVYERIAQAARVARMPCRGIVEDEIVLARHVASRQVEPMELFHRNRLGRGTADFGHQRRVDEVLEVARAVLYEVGAKTLGGERVRGLALRQPDEMGRRFGAHYRRQILDQVHLAGHHDRAQEDDTL